MTESGVVTESGEAGAAYDFWSDLAAHRKTGWAAIRDAGPVIEIGEDVAGLEGLRVFGVSRRADVLEVLRDATTFSSVRHGDGWALPALGLPMPMVGLNPPEHTRLREIIMSPFGAREIQGLATVLEDLAFSLIDPVAGRGQCDAIVELALPYATGTVLAHFGLPVEHAHQVGSWVDMAWARTPDAVTQLRDYFAEAAAERRTNPDQPGLLTYLVKGGLTDDEMTGFCVFALLNAVMDMWSTLASLLLALASQPQLQGLLRRDPQQTGCFVDEILRLEPVTETLGRLVTQDTEIAGVTIPAGAAVLTRPGCANREGVPDEIDLREGRIVPHKHLTWGAGPHRCPGASLARTAMTILVKAWLHRVPDFQTAPWAVGTRAEVVDAGKSGRTFFFRHLGLCWTPNAETST